MLFLTDTALGRSQSLTSEGYLVAKDTVIARTGQQIYHQTELPELAANADGWISVSRDAGEVFAPAAIASLAGKPIIDEHVDEIGPHNWSEHAIGFVSNPRRGNGVNSDCVVADLVFTTKRGIDLVRSGKRALSVGYQAEYTQNRPGFAAQHDIRANHLSLVDEGRCGPRCAIGDARPKRKTADKATLINAARAREVAEQQRNHAVSARVQEFWRQAHA